MAKKKKRKKLEYVTRVINGDTKKGRKCGCKIYSAMGQRVG